MRSKYDRRVIAHQKMQKLNQLMGFPQTYPTIYVTGTDGKGSTTNMLASILIEAGYKVGTFNTPGIKNNSTNDIKINGVDISRKDYKRLKTKVNRVIEEHNIDDVNKKYPIRFGAVLFMTALLYFQENEIDICIVECIKGGETCVTGITYPMITAITNITSDHLEQFNDDFYTYALDKIKTIKPFTPIFIGETPTNKRVRNAIVKLSTTNHAPLTFADKSNYILNQAGECAYSTKLGTFELESKGDFQRHNLNLVLHIIEYLRKKNYTIEESHIRNGLKYIYKNTGFGGRWQVLKHNPNVILDGVHTSNAWSKVMNQLSKLSSPKINILVSLYADKDIDKMIGTFLDDERITYYFITCNEYKRLITPEEMMNKTNHMVKSKRCMIGDIDETLDYVMSNSGSNDIVFVGCTLLYIDKVLSKFKSIDHR